MAIHQGDFGTCTAASARQGDAHLARRNVGDAAHRVYGFKCGTRGNHHLHAKQRFARPHIGQQIGQLCGFQHAPHADFSAGLFTRCGLKDYHAIVFELLNVAQIGRIEPHLHIHRRRDDQRAGAGGDQIADEIVGDAVRDFGDGVGRSGRNQHHIGFAREVDVGHAIAA